MWFAPIEDEPEPVFYSWIQVTQLRGLVRGVLAAQGRRNIARLIFIGHLDFPLSLWGDLCYKSEREQAYRGGSHRPLTLAGYTFLIGTTSLSSQAWGPVQPQKLTRTHALFNRSINIIHFVAIVDETQVQRQAEALEEILSGEHIDEKFLSHLDSYELD
jgi:hypothetical protein